MADIRTSGMGGVPKGTTADRPSSPSVGDVFYNGTFGSLEIYTSSGWVAASAPPATPTIGTITYSAQNQPYNNASISIPFTAGTGGGLQSQYTASSTSGGFTNSASSSPITISGLQSANQYSFTVNASNNFGTSGISAPSNSISITTVPQAPTIGTATAGTASASVTFTPGSTGGSSITGYTVTSSPGNITGTGSSSPITVSGLNGNTAYTFTVTATNANGTSLASSASNSVTPTPIVTVTGGTLASDSTYYYRVFTGNGTLGVSGYNLTADILKVGGGGGGGAGEGSNGSGGGGGGGGAGGVVYLSGQSLIGSLAVTVGAGGNGPSSPNTSANTTAYQGGPGTLSQVGSLQIAYPGGGGAAEEVISPSATNWGSGGGAGGDIGTLGTGWTSGQGYQGGTASGRSGGGGGGAGGLGGNAGIVAGSAPGNGGVGTNTYASILSAISSAMTGVSGWSTATSGGYIAGGGGGGSGSGYTSTLSTGGSGGGGAGSQNGGGGQNSGSYSGGNGIANTGSGGGAHAAGNASGGKAGNGGAGIVVVRYTRSQAGG